MSPFANWYTWSIWLIWFDDLPIKHGDFPWSFIVMLHSQKLVPKWSAVSADPLLHSGRSLSVSGVQCATATRLKPQRSSGSSVQNLQTLIRHGDRISALRSHGEKGLVLQYPQDPQPPWIVRKKDGHSCHIRSEGNWREYASSQPLRVAERGFMSQKPSWNLKPPETTIRWASESIRHPSSPDLLSCLGHAISLIQNDHLTATRVAHGSDMGYLSEKKLGDTYHIYHMEVETVEYLEISGIEPPVIKIPQPTCDRIWG